MLKRETLARKARHIFNHVESYSTLTCEGIDYRGIIESSSYATKYRDNGWLEGTIKTWIGVASDLKFIPKSGLNVICDKIEYSITGTNSDPLTNIIRIDLGDKAGEYQG
jgi:hypothetical protein